MICTGQTCTSTHATLIRRIKKVLRLLVASEDGYLYLYALNVEEGGDCNLMRQFKLMDEKAEDGERLKNAPNETAQSTHKPGKSFLEQHTYVKFTSRYYCV